VRVTVVIADLFGVEGDQMLDRLDLPAPYTVTSRWVVEFLDTVRVGAQIMP